MSGKNECDHKLFVDKYYSSDDGVDERRTSKSSPIMQNSLFQEYIDWIWYSLRQDNVQSVGVYGLGGVGKSTLVREIFKDILNYPGEFDHAYWIDVLPDSNVSGLQHKIAQQLKTNLPKDNGVFEIREALMEALMEKGRSIIILDNMWKDIPIEDVGIPLDKKYCTLIITSRSLDVCRRMGCHKKNIIKVEPLDTGVAQKLFERTLIGEIPLNLKAISKVIVETSYRLPSQISKLARNLRGEDHICEWRNELNKLKSLPNSDNEEIYDSIILSYNNFNDSASKECFLRCSLLFPRNYEIGRECLINLLIVDGVIERMESRRAEFDKGHTMLNKLQNICLLDDPESDFNEICVGRLVRDMALKKLGKDSWVVIDTEEKMVNLQKKVNWEMEKLSLFEIGKMTETLMKCSPNCPNLRTLILRGFQNLSSISESFFKQMHRLTFLDLAKTHIIELPDSISDLVDLAALILHDCTDLEFVPSLEKLILLETLDLGGCESLKKLPKGMDNLFKLRCLNLMNTFSVEEFPSEILHKLQHLQSLEVNRQLLVAKDVQRLKKLECLNCMFNEKECIETWTSILKEGKQILLRSDYDIKVCGVLYEYDVRKEDAEYQEMIGKELEFNSCTSEDLQIPRDVEDLKIVKCDGLRSLHNIHPIKNATELSFLGIYYCGGLETLFSLSAVSSVEPTFPNKGVFSHLKDVYVRGCGSIRKLFPRRLLKNLQQLEVIDVDDCKLLEEVIATEDEGCTMSSDERSSGVPSTNINATLPNLKSLLLGGLPELKSICSGKLVCNALRSLTVGKCPKLRRMPISFSGLDDGQLSPHHPPFWLIGIECEVWEYLEWEDPQAKARIASYFY